MRSRKRENQVSNKNEPMVGTVVPDDDDPFVDSEDGSYSQRSFQEDPTIYDTLEDFKRFEDIGDSVTGTFLGWEELKIVDKGVEKPLKVFSVWNDQLGKLIRFNGTFQLEVLTRVPRGIRIQITLVGKERTLSGFEVHSFRLGIHRDDRAKASKAITSEVRKMLEG